MAIEHVPYECLADRGDVALSPTLDLQRPAWTQRAGQPPPQAIVIGDPMKRRCREDRIDGLVELQVEHVLAPHLGAVAQPLARERHHVVRRVDGQHAPSRHDREERLRDATCAQPTSSTVASGAMPCSRGRTSEAHACWGSLERS